MTIKLTLGTWISHDNMLLSAARYHAHRTGQKIAFECVPEGGLPLATFLLEAEGRRMFLDYNDRYELDPAGADADVYAKRSLRPEAVTARVLPLGFHFNYSFELHHLLAHRGFLSLKNRTEILRCVDFTGRTGWSHFERRVHHLFTPPVDHGGRVIFYVRLWEPARNRDPEEQERRRKMNLVRVEAVRALRKLENTAAGIIPDDFAHGMCPDLLLSPHQTTSKAYGAELRRADIGVANEGLRGSPGWKIGEYVAGGKAVLSNTIESVIPGFEVGTNYLRFDDPREIPDLVRALRKDGSYRAMQAANWQYTVEHLHPDRYLPRILERLLG